MEFFGRVFTKVYKAVQTTLTILAAIWSIDHVFKLGLVPKVQKFLIEFQRILLVTGDLMNTQVLFVIQFVCLHKYYFIVLIMLLFFLAIIRGLYKRQMRINRLRWEVTINKRQFTELYGTWFNLLYTLQFDYEHVGIVYKSLARLMNHEKSIDQWEADTEDLEEELEHLTLDYFFTKELTPDELIFVLINAKFLSDGPLPILEGRTRRAHKSSRSSKSKSDKRRGRKQKRNLLRNNRRRVTKGGLFKFKKFDDADMQYFKQLTQAYEAHQIDLNFLNDVLFQYGFGMDDDPYSEYKFVELGHNNEEYREDLNQFYLDNDFYDVDEPEEEFSDDGDVWYEGGTVNVVYVPPLLDMGRMLKSFKDPDWKQKVKKAGLDPAYVKPFYNVTFRVVPVGNLSGRPVYKLTPRAMRYFAAVDPEGFQKSMNSIDRYNIRFEKFEIEETLEEQALKGVVTIANNINRIVAGEKNSLEGSEKLRTEAEIQTLKRRIEDALMTIKELQQEIKGFKQEIKAAHGAANADKEFRKVAALKAKKELERRERQAKHKAEQERLQQAKRARKAENIRKNEEAKKKSEIDMDFVEDIIESDEEVVGEKKFIQKIDIKKEKERAEEPEMVPTIDPFDEEEARLAKIAELEAQLALYREGRGYQFEGKNAQSNPSDVHKTNFKGFIFHCSPNKFPVIRNDEVFGVAARYKYDGRIFLLMNSHVINDINKHIASKGPNVKIGWVGKNGKVNEKRLKDFHIVQNHVEHDVAVVTFECCEQMRALSIDLVDKTKEFNGQITMVHFQAGSVTKFEVSSAKPVITVNNDKVKLRSYVQTKPGDCGTPVLRDNRAYGLHQMTYGQNNGNAQIAFTKELMDLIVEGFKPQQKN